jgi:uncharacterized protein YqkB
MSNQTFQLPSGKNLDVIKNQIENQKPFLALKKSFEEKGFEFIYSRSKIFVTHDTARANASPSLFCIIPSLVPLDLKKDPHHKAVGIVVFINNGKYAYFATEVLVNHKPFQIENYTLYGFGADRKKPDKLFSVPRKQLASKSIKQISSGIKNVRIDQKRTINANIPEADFEFIIKDSLSDFLNDEFTKHQPGSYKNSMLKETSVILKFSQAIAFKKQQSASLASWSCSSTCCNGCTTTSCSWSLSAATKA